MPYAIEKCGNKWVVFNTETKAVKGRHDSKIEAQRQKPIIAAGTNSKEEKKESQKIGGE